VGPKHGGRCPYWWLAQQSRGDPKAAEALSLLKYVTEGVGGDYSLQDSLSPAEGGIKVDGYGPSANCPEKFRFLRVFGGF
jgi:hypothetical protein